MVFNWRSVKSGLLWSWSLEDSSLQNLLWHFTVIIKTMGVNMDVDMTKYGLNIIGLVSAVLVIFMSQFGLSYGVITWDGHRRYDTECMYLSCLELPLKLVWLTANRRNIMELLNMAIKQNASLTSIEEAAHREEMKVNKWRLRTFATTQTTFAILYEYAGMMTGVSSTPSFPVLYPGIEDETIFPNVAIYGVIRQILLMYTWCMALTVWIMFSVIVGHACAHARAIAAEISSLKSNDVNLTSRIRYIVKRHQELKAFVDGINNLIVLIIGPELAIMFIATCATFQELCDLTAIFTGMTLGLSLLYCCFGQYLISCEDTIEAAIYNSDWHNMEPQDAKMLMLVLMNSQDPPKLKTFKVFELTNATYMAFIKMLYSAFSFIAVLKT